MDFQMESRESNKDLHVRVSGIFDGDAAEALIGLLRRLYNGAGRIFIDTRGLVDLYAHGCRGFRQALARESLPVERLFFKGEQGFQLGPDGSRVLIMKKKSCRCGGACRECACAKRLRERHARVARRSALVASCAG